MNTAPTIEQTAKFVMVQKTAGTSEADIRNILKRGLNMGRFTLEEVLEYISTHQIEIPKAETPKANKNGHKPKVEAGDAALAKRIEEANARGEAERAAKPPAPTLHPMDLSDFVVEKIPERKLLLSPFLAEKSIGMIHAWRGVGKTHIGLGMAIAVATGTPFLKWNAPEQTNVLYVDGEMGDDEVQDMARRALRAQALTTTPKGRFTLIAADREPAGIPSLFSFVGQSLIEDEINRIGAKGLVLVLDNISSLFTGGDEKEGSDWSGADRWLLHLRQMGVTTILIHHDGKGGSQRGTSMREDHLNWVIQLEHPRNYDMSEGLKANVFFRKTRKYFGAEARSFQVHLTYETVTGMPNWTVKDLEETQAVDIYRMRVEHRVPFRDIASELKLSKSQVHRLFKSEEKRRKETSPTGEPEVSESPEVGL